VNFDAMIRAAEKERRGQRRGKEEGVVRRIPWLSVWEGKES
jgi:hypothetical protein